MRRLPRCSVHSALTSETTSAASGIDGRGVAVADWSPNPRSQDASTGSPNAPRGLHFGRIEAGRQPPILVCRVVRDLQIAGLIRRFPTAVSAPCPHKHKQPTTAESGREQAASLAQEPP